MSLENLRGFGPDMTFYLINASSKQISFQLGEVFAIA